MIMSNTTITIPPFPSQDLAKLVLGYLAEEQLMTAYDEFLQASPYLDALRNEYDRIFMTSLKNILAEYRAVKIYVETCKPFILRRKLFQCTNLLEIVKYLVNNVDINKLHLQEGSVDKTGSSRQSFTKCNSCDVCTSLKLPTCVCRSSQSTSEIEATSLEGSVETTSLADLPGNISYKKKITKEVEPKNNTSQSITSSNQVIDGRSAKVSDNLSSTTFRNNTTDNVISSVTEKKSAPSPSLLIKEHQPEVKQNVQGSNNVLNLVSHSRSDNASKQKDCNDTETCTNMVGTDKLQNFTTGDISSSNKVIVPDSSTSENTVLQTSTPDAEAVTNSPNVGKGVTRPPPHLIKIGNEHKHMSLQQSTVHTLPRLSSKEHIKPINKKSDDQNSPKITILSDVKVDNDIIMPPVLKGTRSTLQMQTLFINGTPAYKTTQKVEHTFTKDEIMAMPTIILVPATDTTKKIVPTVTQNNMLNSLPVAVSCSTSQSLEPLVIDVSSNDESPLPVNNLIKNDSGKNLNKETNDNMLIKTVDTLPVNHASLPKDNALAGLKASTPHVHPPARKSSSTPRRTSHVRVLDFTTPRRILHETLNDQEINQHPSNDVALAPDSSSLANNNNSEGAVNKVNNNVDTCNNTNIGATKENKTSIKLFNWDADLRALAYVGNGNVEKSEPKQKSKPKKLKTKLSPTDKSTTNKHKKSEVTKTNKSNDKKTVTPKIKSTKAIKKSIEAVKETQESTVAVVKPTINIISRKKWTEPVEIEKTQIKSSNIDGNVDTPELERISLQNEIGAKLNISDFLETPYKQALYDIQMETPKFLGPDILDDPLSDIKIMNIPTPRFFNTPKLSQNTPSSYSSRPTDYSSGGSYYKPDDQDYVLGNEMIENDLSVSAALSKVNKGSKVNEIQNVNVEKGHEGKSRPVRQCTKNVSYNFSTPSSSKTKDAEEKIDKLSTCSESSINKTNKKMEKSKIRNSNKDSTAGKQRESKKRSKKYKSPIKKDTPKTFMKIKPRRTTPVKQILGKGRKKATDLSQVVYIKPQPKKVLAGKERNVCFSPIAVVSVPTKSRRKSSTPRKLHYTKRFNSESPGINSPERKKKVSQTLKITNLNALCSQDSDSDQPLRWSDDGSQESKLKTNEEIHLANESDDITKIKEYIKTTVPSEMARDNEVEGTLQVDLIKRGFDVETARMIERDLLETPAHNLPNQKIPIQNILQTIPSPISSGKDNESKFKKNDKSTESDCGTSNNLQIVQDENDSDELDFAVDECNEDTNNYFVYNYDETNFTPSDLVKLKETFLMEICIENDVPIRLRAMPFNTAFEHETKQDDLDDCSKKIIEKSPSPTLYTPRKAQCYELFDSTLASLDTPLKSNSPKAQEFETVTEIVLEVEKLETDIKLKPEIKKRKRVQSGTSDDSSNGSKKVKPDTSYLLNSAGIQNIDIESVLSKLHGP